MNNCELCGEKKTYKTTEDEKSWDKNKMGYDMKAWLYTCECSRYFSDEIVDMRKKHKPITGNDLDILRALIKQRQIIASENHWNLDNINGNINWIKNVNINDIKIKLEDKKLGSYQKDVLKNFLMKSIKIKQHIESADKFFNRFV